MSCADCWIVFVQNSFASHKVGIVYMLDLLPRHAFGDGSPPPTCIESRNNLQGLTTQCFPVLHRVCQVLIAAKRVQLCLHHVAMGCCQLQAELHCLPFAT